MSVPCSVGANRRPILQQLHRWNYNLNEEYADTVLLLVSELLTNGVRHSRSDLLTMVIYGREDEVFIGTLSCVEYPSLQAGEGMRPGVFGAERWSVVSGWVV
jgi:hypothetical protein